MRSLAIQTARHLRKNSTKAEKLFWEIVRNRQIKNVKFNRQFPIYFEYDGLKRFFIADFYCHEKKLIIEIDGGIHEQQKDYDELRTVIINELGITVIRFNNEIVLNNTDEVILELKDVL
ncbi:MAG: endonuclease domain-containing protein [Candidatus Cloacimonetes bacterium]|nr:endonuclease domain-containing protein [Candidatus Cloacimonadota bacterium]